MLCTFCNETFSSKYNLNRHIKTCKQNVQKVDLPNGDNAKIVCSHCTKSFVSAYNLKRHALISCPFTSTQNVRFASYFSCEHCEKRFKLRNVFLNHVQSCPAKLCDTEDVGMLNVQHTASESSFSNDKQGSAKGSTVNTSLTCQFCQVQFSNEVALIDHLVRCPQVRKPVYRLAQKRLEMKAKRGRQNKVLKTVKANSKKKIKIGYGPMKGKHKQTYDDTVQFDEIESLSPPTGKLKMNKAQIAKKKRQFLKSKNGITCRKCGQIFPNVMLHKQHYATFHKGVGGMKPRPWKEGSNPPWLEDGNVNLEFKETYERYEAYIRYNDDTSRDVYNTYNFPTNDLDGGVDEIMEKLTDVATQQSKSFVIQINFGYITENLDDLEQPYKYFGVVYGRGYLRRRIVISRLEDLARVRQILEERDVHDYLKNLRPNTKTVLKYITNFTFSLAFLDFVMGRGIVPSYIKNCRFIKSLDVSKDRKEYKDNLCIFRCLAYHKNKTSFRANEYFAQRYYYIWRKYMHVTKFVYLPKNCRRYRGITYDDLPLFESCFKLQLKIYERMPDTAVHPIYLSMRSDYKDELYLNLYGNHLSFVCDFSSYAKKFQCNNCSMFFRAQYLLKRHRLVCFNRTNLKYPGGIMKPNLTVFEELEEYEIFVPKADRTYPWFCCFDFESILKNDASEMQNAVKEQRISTHVPVSVSLCSNITGFDNAYTIVDQDVDSLAKRMIVYLKQIQSIAFSLAKEKWSYVFDLLQKTLDKWKPMQSTQSEKSVDPLLSEHFNLNSITCNGDQQALCMSDSSRMYSKIKDLCMKFILYCSRLVVLSFNGGRYDIQLIKSKLIKYLGLHKEKRVFVVKRGSCYVSIQSQHFRFLDLVNFLSPGCSYKKFLSTFNVSQTKSYFPYEYLNKFEKLKETNLPAYEAFYSSLKKENVLESDMNEWVRNGRKGSMPNTGQENYQMLQNVWNEQNMQTLEDLLIHYNGLDCEPMCEAVTKMVQMYSVNNNIDLFKQAVSSPSVSRYLLFDTVRRKRVIFSLFDSVNSDLYTLFKKNVFGGPSILFSRMQSVDETFLRNNRNKPCKSIDAFDVNSLYSYCFTKPMPAGLYVRRFRENGFIPDVNYSHLEMYFWLEYESRLKKVKIDHYMSIGKEVTIGNFRVDGFCGENSTIYEVRSRLFSVYIYVTVALLEQLYNY